jgi:hypothetical protein
MGRAELGDLPPAPPVGGVPMSRAIRAARAVAPFARPLSAVPRELQRRMIYDKLGRLDRRAWAVVNEKLNPAWALRAGLLCFGLPVDGGPTGGHAASVHQRDAVCWVETPIGRFLLTPGTEIDEDALESLPVIESGPEDAPVDVAEQTA